MNANLPIRKNVELKDFCTFGIGGPCRYFIEITTVAQMQEAIVWCKNAKCTYMVLGKGSNCLFDDRGFNGAILLNKITFIEEPSVGTFHVGAGYSFALLGVQTARKNWEGLEFASGIPATVGGAVYMNAGANGAETCTHLHSVDFVDDNGILHVKKRQDLQFSYRHSPFQGQKGAIVAATFILKPNSEARKKQIEIVNYRKNTQPYNNMSAGCVFLNPSCASAGALIERSGLKGSAVGDAQVSTKHANFLINAGAASCKDMQSLIQLVQTKVKRDTGNDLTTEVRYIPYQESLND